MAEDGSWRPPGPMHRASVLLREILVLNEVMEFTMRRDMDLNESDFQAMQHLLKNRSMSPGELAQSLHLTAAATTTVIDRLTSKGHVCRTAHPTDRRRWLIHPSEDSIRKTMEKIMPMIMEVDTKVRSYDNDGQEVIVDFLDSIVTSMNSRVAALQHGDITEAAGPALPSIPMTASQKPREDQP